ncbi:MAG: arginine deiminase family protein [Pseudomonadota bacterium]|nr:arginine deiminase family protein [Pseudomonadota bacterium]
MRPPGELFANGLTSSSEGRPKLAKALIQHEAYCRALRACGLVVHELRAEAGHPDGTFVEDTAIVAPRVAIATRPGAESRRGEVSSVAALLARLRGSLEVIEAPGTLDGGDVCQVDEHFLIGLSARTNEAGAAQLRAILSRHAYTSSIVDMRTQRKFLHLKSGIAYLGGRCFVGAHDLQRLCGIADEEFLQVSEKEGYAANCIQVNDRVLIAAGYPAMAQALAARGCRIEALDMSEFRKMDGGLSCLSLRF